MKRLLIVVISATLSLMLHAQDTPMGINYQAVARDNLGVELAYKDIDVKFSIYQNSPSGTLEWEETQKTQTNKFGLFTLVIGQTSHRTGGIAKNIDSINWGSGPHYLKVDIDFGNGYVNMGTTQMMAVPYALYAKNAGNGGGHKPQITYNPDNHKLYADGEEIADFSGIGSGAVQSIEFKDNTLIYSQNGQTYRTDFSKYMDNTDKQSLSLIGKVLSISNGNSVTLPDTVIQNLSLNNRILSISRGNSVTLPDQIQDLMWANDTTLQITNNPNASRINLRKFLNNQLTTNRNTLAISNGNSVVVNTDTTKQDLSISSDTILQITNNPNASRINLKKFLNNQLTTGRNTLSISNGNSVVVNTDTTKQDLLFTNDTLSITRNSSAKKVGLKKYLDNTDNQTLTLSGNNLSISGLEGGNTVDVSNLVNTPWEGFSYNNNSGLGILGTQEVQISWNKEFDDGNIIQNNAMVSTTNEAVYSISLNLSVTSYTGIKVKLYKGTTEYKTIDLFNNFLSTNFLTKLSQGESISIKIQNTTAFGINLIYANFSGYRVH